MYSTITPIIETLVFHIAGENNDLGREEVEKTLIDFAEEVKEQTLSEVTPLRKGVTLRDQFAMSALNGLIACSDTNVSNVIPHHFAQMAYEIADVMLEARKTKAID